MKIDGISIIALLAVFLGLVTLSGSLILTDDNSKDKTPESTGRQLDKIDSNRGLLKKVIHRCFHWGESGSPM